MNGINIKEKEQYNKYKKLKKTILIILTLENGVNISLEVDEDA